MKKILIVSVLLVAFAVPSFACGPAAMCMDNPAYAGCASAAQNTKESCNNSAGSFCTASCNGSQDPGTCTANCLTSAFNSCQSWYCSDMDGCLEEICFQN